MGTALNRHMLTCNSMTTWVYPKEKSFVSFDDKKAAKYASPISIMGFADFETKQKFINKEVNLENTLGKMESFTTRTCSHEIVSFSLIFVDIMEDIFFQNIRQD